MFSRPASLLLWDESLELLLSPDLAEMEKHRTRKEKVRPLETTDLFSVWSQSGAVVSVGGSAGCRRLRKERKPVCISSNSVTVRDKQSCRVYFGVHSQLPSDFCQAAEEAAWAHCSATSPFYLL